MVPPPGRVEMGQKLVRVPWHNVVADMLVRGSRVGPITDRERTSVTGAAFWVWLTICVSG